MFMKNTISILVAAVLVSGCISGAPKPSQLSGKPRVKVNQQFDSTPSTAAEDISVAKPINRKRTIKYDDWTVRSVFERWATDEDLELDWRSDTDFVITDQDRKGVYQGELVQAIRKLLVNHTRNNQILNVANNGQQVLVGNLDVLDEAGVYQIYDADRSLKDVLFRWARLGERKLQWKVDYDLPIPLAARLQTYETDLYKSVALFSMYYELVNKSIKVDVDQATITVTENPSSRK